MDSNDIDEIMATVNEIKNDVKKKFIEHPYYAIIVVLGLTGSGKSSLVDSLTNKKIIVGRNKNGFMNLIGEGIMDGYESVTEKPVVHVDDENQILICDCPGFLDSHGSKNEIINSFADDYLLVANESDIKVKILLVACYSEFLTGRGKVIYDTIKRMERMFSDPVELKNGIGFVITKGDINCNGEKYFKNIVIRADEKLKKWCDYFTAFNNQVFCFPSPSKKELGKQYIFSDKERLLSFISNDYLDNPKHRISLSDDAISQLRIIRAQHVIDIKDIVAELFLLINEEYRNLGESCTLRYWIDNMRILLTQKINNTKDFKAILQKIIPNNEKYNGFFKKFEEFETFDMFIDKIPEISSINSCLQDTIHSLAMDAIQELEQMQKFTEKFELQERSIEEQSKIISQCHIKLSDKDQTINQLKFDINNQIRINETNQKQSKDKIDQLNRTMQKQKEESDRKFSEMMNKFYDEKNISASRQENYQKELQNLKDLLNKSYEEIEELKNRPPQVIYKKTKKCLIA